VAKPRDRHGGVAGQAASHPSQAPSHPSQPPKPPPLREPAPDPVALLTAAAVFVAIALAAWLGLFRHR